MNHDQNFKNLILDYPRAALAFFAGAEGVDLPESVRIVPLRQEQLQERLGERFRELDIPLLVEWPDGQRAAMLFVVEEETEPQRFSIYRLAHYCLDLAELVGTERVTPVVIFLRAGRYPRVLDLHGDHASYLRFSYIACELASLPAAQYLTSTNIVARLNLLNMQYDPAQRVKIYASAQEGLAALELDPEKRLKYADFIEAYAHLSETEWVCYCEDYLPNSTQREVIMGLVQRCREEGRREGIQLGRQEGRQEGIQTGIQTGIREGLLAGIELGLELKFGTAGHQLLPEIRTIESVEHLRTLHDGLRTADSLEAVRRLYQTPAD